ncbi:hypothetical protein ACFQDF_31565 [Ectobacillus funiculus]
MRKRKQLSTFLLTMMLCNTVSGIIPQSSFAEEPEKANLILDYDMNNIEGTKVKIILGSLKESL